MEQVKFNCTLSFWDCSEALRLHRRQTVGSFVRFLLIYRVAPVLCVVGLVLIGGLRTRVQTLPGWLVLSFAVALLWVGIVMAFSPSENVRRFFRRSVSTGEVSICADDECVLVRVPGIGETRTFWKALVGFARNDKVILLYTSKDCFLVFPTSAMSTEQQADLNRLIERNLARR